MKSLRNASIALLLVYDSVKGQEDFKPIHGYVIGSTSTDTMNLGRDLDAMQQILSAKDESALGEAFEIYSRGAYGETTATLDLKEPLPFEVPAGTIATGQSLEGELVSAEVREKIPAGSMTVKLVYTEEEGTCLAGGLSGSLRQDQGCFVSPGFLHFGNEEKAIHFSYDDEQDNQPERNIRDLSANATKHFSLFENPNNSLYPFFTKYATYYGRSKLSFADDMIQAFLYRIPFEFTSGRMDFTFADAELRSDFMELTAAYLNMGLSVIGKLEDSVLECHDVCPKKDCNRRAIEDLDEAAAFYTGVMQQEDGSGNLLYGLADSMCQQFKTCGKNGDELTGTAKVNLDIFALFNSLKQNINEGHCENAKENKDRITNLVFVPIIQGFLFSTFRLDQPALEFPDIRDGTVPFAAALFPLLDECKNPAVQNIDFDFKPGYEKGVMHLFNTIKNDLPDYYDCMGLCCHDIGGIWDDEEDRYFKNNAPCVDVSDACKVKSGKQKTTIEKKSGKPWMVIVFLAALVVTVVLYRRRSRHFPESRRRNPDPVDDDASVDSQDGMHIIT